MTLKKIEKDVLNFLRFSTLNVDKQDRAKLAIKFCNENKDEQKSEQAQQILNKHAVRNRR